MNATPLQCIVNVFRACVGLPAEDFMQLEHKVTSPLPPSSSAFILPLSIAFFLTPFLSSLSTSSSWTAPYIISHHVYDMIRFGIR